MRAAGFRGLRFLSLSPHDPGRKKVRSGSYQAPPAVGLVIPKGPKYLYGTKSGFCSSNFPYGLGKYSPYGYLGPFGDCCSLNPKSM